VDFELNSKCMVDNFHSIKLKVSNFGAILIDCRCVHSIFLFFLKYCHVKFVRRQTNTTAHTLSKSMATSLISFDLFIDILTYIRDIIINKMHFLS
jgi:hypothetical protein